MNLEYLKNHVDNNTPVFDFELKEDGSNKNAFYSADVVGNRRFAQNYGGYPRSDIAEINEQASLVVAQNLLRDLQVVPADDKNAGLSDIQIMLGHKSKYQQSPSEMTDWLESQLAIRDAKRHSEIPKDNEGTINFDTNDDPNVNSEPNA